MKHPVANDIDASVTEAGVTVTFKPINSIHNFYRLANNDDIARLGPVSLARVRPAGPTGDTGNYAPNEVQDMAKRIAADAWTALLVSEKADRLTLKLLGENSELSLCRRKLNTVTNGYDFRISCSSLLTQLLSKLPVSDA